MSNKNEVFEYLIDQLRQQVDNGPYKQQCEDLAREVRSLKNQLRDASKQIKELHLGLVKATGDVEAYKLIRTQEQSGCRKEDTQDSEPWIEWEGGECPVPKYAIVQIRMRDGINACEPGVAGDLRWGHRGLGGDIISYRVVKPGCEHDWLHSKHKSGFVCFNCGVRKS